jgi:hypothetical protein
LRFFYIKTKEQVSFKRRKPTYKLFTKLNFGNIGFFYKKQIRFEYLYFFFFKKLLKLLNKNKYLTYDRFFFWFFLKGNFPLTKKSKNSRMGKGKGMFLRWVINLLPNFIFIELLTYKQIFFFKYFNKKKNLISPNLMLYIKNL